MSVTLEDRPITPETLPEQIYIEAGFGGSDFPPIDGDWGGDNSGGDNEPESNRKINRVLEVVSFIFGRPLRMMPEKAPEHMSNYVRERRQ